MPCSMDRKIKGVGSALNSLAELDDLLRVTCQQLFLIHM